MNMLAEEVVVEGNISMVGAEQIAIMVNITAIVVFVTGALFYCLTYWRIKKMQIS
jgi:hypothetical protein